MSGPSFELVESKLRRPVGRQGIVARTALVERLLAAPAALLLTVEAPPGYGKTILLSQWAERKAPRVAWVNLDRRDNDLASLLTYIAVALDRVEPIDPEVYRALAAPGASVLASAVPRLGAAVSAMPGQVAVVLDNVEVLDNPRCLDAVAELAARLPKGSQLALASRTRPALPARLLDDDHGRVVHIGTADLAMDQREARALLAGSGLRLGDAQVAELLRRTEGWPVGLYLAVLALEEQASRGDAPIGFTGDDRLVADYLSSELLSRLPGPTVSFLTRTSVLERMCGPLCDAVLESSGSAALLKLLERSNLLVVPLDRRCRWYRYHHLFRDLLQARLARREPEVVPQLHLRAAAWYQANGLPELAVDHAQAAGDAGQVAGLVARLAFTAYAGGRVDTVRGWVAWFEERGLIERYPPVAVLGAVVDALVGRSAAAERLAAAAERGPPGGVPPGGGTMAGYLALLRAFLCRAGVARMRADAELAGHQLAPGSQWGGAALLLEGISHVLAGDLDRADPVLARAAEPAGQDGGTTFASTALAERALVAIERDDWRRAESLAERAHRTIRAGRRGDDVPSAFTDAVAARVAAHRGDSTAAEEHLARATRLRPALTWALPHLAVQTLLQLAHVALALDEPAGARAVLSQARQVLQHRPDLGALPGLVEELQSKLATIRGGTAGAASLTTAELRLLPLLATHLTFREIGQRLYISPHTVKSQAMSIYRKLGAASRGQAIERAQFLGLHR
jgi:LuxR family transcriptional regulator, maltose regulon positive regulatory protein